MSGKATSRGEADEPRWVSGRAAGSTDPLAVYEQTYSAISDFQVARRRARRKGAVLRRVGLSAFVLAALALAALAMLAGLRPLQLGWPWPRAARPVLPLPRMPRAAYAPDVIGTTPTRPKATLRVGETRDFAVVAAADPELHYGWTVDGRPVGTGPLWVYAPQPSDVGRRRIEVMVNGREGAERRAWNVRVRPARAPELLDAQPAPGTVELVAGSVLRLRIDPHPASPVERLSVSWQLDGVHVGEGNVVTLHPERPGVSVVRAVVRSDLGSATTREWRVSVVPPREEPPAPVGAPPAARVAQAVPPHPRFAVRAPDRPSTEQDVRRWLERYAAAWRAHDVETLRRMGQVTTDGEVAALRRYFESVHDLDVELNVVAMRTDGDRTTVRFTRLDRFRDPAGHLVLKESPVLEKQVVRTPDGMRFARPTG